MIAAYPAKYTDRFGEVATTIYNDGLTLRLELRGAQFSGADLDGLELENETEAKKLVAFPLHPQFRYLCSCTLEWEMPIELLADGATIPGKLHACLELGNPSSNGGIDREVLKLTLRYTDKTIQSRGASGWFEDELIDLQKVLPAEIYLRTCFGCSFSDYSPYGHGLFGNMACFRHNKKQYLEIQTKDELFEIWHTCVYPVQETYVCPDYQVRKPGTGYRG
jgi:hypothetical protein